MKNLKKIATARLLAAILLLAVCMAGCAAPAEPNSGVPSKTDAPAESDSSGAPADAPQALTLPILDEIDADVTVGTAGSSLLAVQAAVKLLDWGVNTGLDTDEIGTAASAWLSAKNDDRTECLQKLELVDEAYQKLLTDEARELLDDAGCAEVEITWGSEPVEPVEAIMRSAGLRDADSGDDAAWDVAGFEKSLLENYGVTPITMRIWATAFIRSMWRSTARSFPLSRSIPRPATITGDRPARFQRRADGTGKPRGQAPLPQID